MCVHILRNTYKDSTIIIRIRHTTMFVFDILFLAEIMCTHTRSSVVREHCTLCHPRPFPDGLASIGSGYHRLLATSHHRLSLFSFSLSGDSLPLFLSCVKKRRLMCSDAHAARILNMTNMHHMPHDHMTTCRTSPHGFASPYDERLTMDADSIPSIWPGSGASSKVGSRIST